MTTAQLTADWLASLPDDFEEAKAKTREELTLEALDEADIALMVCNFCDDLSPQARAAILRAWPLVQQAIAGIKADRRNRA